VCRTNNHGAYGKWQKVKLMLPVSNYPQPPTRCDIRSGDIQDAAMAMQIVRHLAQQYGGKGSPILDNLFRAIHESLRSYCGAASPPFPRELASAGSNPDAPGPPDTGEQHGRQRCSICCDHRCNEIDVALGRGMSLRQVAEHFQLRKSTVGRHRHHTMKGNHA
jgi:DNA-binding NarL/FixJ family response regulator